MNYATGIRCTRCGKEFPLEPINFCPECGHPGEVHPDNWTLEVVYDLDRLRREIQRSSLGEIRRGSLREIRPDSLGGLRRGSPGNAGETLWRYRELLPIPDEAVTSMGEGQTPLVECKNIARELGISHVYVKDETRNPTGSFKDRMVSLTVSQARQFGHDTILVVSDGNLGSAGAAYSARYGLRCLIMTYPHITEAKLLQMLSYGGRVFDVRGTLRERVGLFLELRRRFGWYVVNLDHVGNPFAVEGYKTIALEIAEQLGWQVPDKVVVPVGSGEGIAGVYKGFKELAELGWTDRLPQIIAAQVSGNDPLVRAVNEGSEEIEPLDEMAPTVVGGINTDVTGTTALEAVRGSNGHAVSADDGEALSGTKLLATREGIYTEPASGTAMAALVKLAKSGAVKPGEAVVVVVTSFGLKDLGATRLIAGNQVEIGPGVDVFLNALGTHSSG